jgi:hypothetical protein
MNVLIVISAPHFWRVESRCIESVINQDAQEHHSLDFAISTNRGEALPSLRLEPVHLNRITKALLHLYDYFFIMQGDILLPEDAISKLLEAAETPNIQRDCISVALCSPRKSTLLDADKEEGEHNHIKELGQSQFHQLNGKPLSRNIEAINRGKPFLIQEYAYFGWNCCLIPSDILRHHPFIESRSLDITWSEEIFRQRPVIIHPGVKVGHIDRDGQVYYGF